MNKEELKLSIQWHITNVCNGNCSYCTYKKIRKTKIPSISFKDELYTALNHIYNMNRPLYEFRFMGSGGEPTMHPNLYDLLLKIEDQFENKLDKNGIWILTNGVKDIEYFKKIKTPNITYNVSVHPEILTNEKAIQFVKEFSDTSGVHINVMYLPKLREKCKNLVDELLKLHDIYNFTSRIVYVRDEPNFTEVLPSYTEDDLKYVKDFNNLLVLKNHDTNKYWEIDDFCVGTYCVQGANVMRINEKGHYSGSSCMLAKYSDESLFRKKLKTKISNNISVGQCNQKRCASDVHMSRGSKFTSLEEASNFIKNIKENIREY